MKIAIAQINCLVGNIEKNYLSIIQYYLEATKRNCDLVIFPELSLSGYLLQDAVLHSEFLREIDEALLRIANSTKGYKNYIIVGAPVLRAGKIHNAAILMGEGKVCKEFYKKHLPNYGVFDEKRFFHSRISTELLRIGELDAGILICEDLWHDDVALDLKNQGAKILIGINSSPFDLGKQDMRLNVIQNITNKTLLPVIYVNRIGADDYLVFDGGSCVVEKNSFIVQPRYWEENLIEIEYKNGSLSAFIEPYENKISENEHIYNALMRGLGDFFSKNGFDRAVLGLSGGIDSSFVAVLAADVLGPENVHCLAMPSMFSSKASFADAEDLVTKIGCNFNTIEINGVYQQILANLQNLWGDLPFDVTEENLQARIRGLLLMATANKTKALPLATSNKSEFAVGYATLYGDMCGALAPISDIYKTKLYELTKWRNILIPKDSKNPKLNLINNNIIEKAPSAELKENQKDTDSLPPYDILDTILYGLIESNLSTIEAANEYNLPLDLVKKIESMVINSEFKRKQAPPGIKISTKAPGIERRFPIAFKGLRHRQ
ncbi:MAG: NAD+ synthase [Candidatus Midichloria mitochondrii]|uniref:Glutamine-dependent NAD(+) synthetase n=1 Tax=Midichloria mitochondrii (strain IricVA) TaxID=696127 RepID=F7XUY0_MIDMI|nr:NAD+ synthase [Candidatus Midichloria mitochondrii]AEI88479.1 NAD+ synthetase [Candidatus Midichloria mitochondrii IricVA]MDJ1256792.1 NAD+ synthase [Candidatus Midichloria mitochondrii]MDJ1288481.1 NAD+ synthase [Candidatus Midichloria mitochondrii]MDJ1299248.1 NAD+ synthase [Candidatus Midichloria mitochondrii]MDJ1313478.1 NAD+ synthase [Candidatus Midichloria mitochondrii]